MKVAFVDNMRCPLCRGDLVVQSSPVAGVLVNGSVRCDCREYPVVDGILLMNPSMPLGHILALVKNGDVHDALSLALELPRSLPLKLVQGLWQGAPSALLENLPGANPMRLLAKLYPAGKGLSYWELALPYDAVQWEYMRQRFASDSFFATHTLLPLAASRRGPLLDLGCGFGHYSFLLGLQGGHTEHLCVDTEFLALLIARRFFAPHANFVQVNGDLPLPFKDGCFELVFGSDMLHYSRTKATTGAEIGRVLAVDGLAILPHTHNAARDNPCPGTPLTLAGYRRVFDGLNLAFFPEEQLVRQALAGEPLDTALEVDAATLEGSYAFAILASHRTAAWHNPILEQSDKSDHSARLVVNPVYQTAIEGDILTCHRRPLSKYYWDEYPASQAYFPEKLLFKRSELRDKGRQRELLQRFLLVQVPPMFVPPRPEEEWLVD